MTDLSLVASLRLFSRLNTTYPILNCIAYPKPADATRRVIVDIDVIVCSQRPYGASVSETREERKKERERVKRRRGIADFKESKKGQAAVMRRVFVLVSSNPSICFLGGKIVKNSK